MTGFHEPLDEQDDDADRHFVVMFGKTKEALQADGLDLEQYVRLHALEGVRNVYSAYKQRAALSEGLLPYWAPSAWIGRGQTKLAESFLGSVSLDGASLRLNDASKTLWDVVPSTVRALSVPLWLGMGVGLSDGSERWNVQPWYSPRSIRRARRATAVFRRALAEAGAITRAQ